MLQRFDNWLKFFGSSANDTQRSAALVQRATEASAGMLAGQDYAALAAALLHLRPKYIFDIGTHSGATADFMLSLLPQSRVTSLEYFPEDDMDAGFSGRPARLAFEQIGAKVIAENRPRFTQVIADTNLIVARDFVARHGAMDFIFIAGEPTTAALAQNTALAQKVLAKGGAIAWHGANPKRKYAAMRDYLENSLGLNALATADTFIGGVALWSPAIEARLLAKAA
jgi:predicted O-methyltransferase YrrM